MTVDIKGLVSAMTSAAKTSFGSSWPKLSDIAQSGITELATSLKTIHDLLANKVISEEQAKFKLELHQNLFKTFLLTEEGIGILTVENALNAMMNVAKGFVGTLISSMI